MAKRPPPRAEPTEPVFTSEHIEKAIARFHRRLAELDKFNPDDIRDRQDPSIAALEVAIEEALGEDFGRGTTSYRNSCDRRSIHSANLLSD